MKLNLNSRVKLSNGIEMPVLGFGTYMLNDEKTVINAVTGALEAGYRLIDTAQMYDNEDYVGEAIRQSGIPREEIFVTTKLDNNQHGFEKSKLSFDESLSRLKLDYVDLFLIHWPIADLRLESWRALIDIYHQGGSRAIGVSNYTIRHLKELFSKFEIKPVVNQVEINPFNYHEILFKFCKGEAIQLEGYTPLIRGKKFKNSIMQELSKKYSKTPAQIMLRWSLQHDVIPIPKSSHLERIKENAAIFNFQIEDKDIKKLDNLNENFRLALDPNEIR